MEQKERLLIVMGSSADERPRCHWIVDARCPNTDQFDRELSRSPEHYLALAAYQVAAAALPHMRIVLRQGGAGETMRSR